MYQINMSDHNTLDDYTVDDDILDEVLDQAMAALKTSMEPLKNIYTKLSANKTYMFFYNLSKIWPRPA